MRMIDADAVLDALEVTEKGVLREEDSFEKTLTISMIRFAKEIIKRFAERSANHGSDG